LYYLKGSYQEKNLVTILKSVEQLKKLEVLNFSKKLSEDSIREGLGNIQGLTNLIGRWHFLGVQPSIIADSAHNEGGLGYAMKQLLETPHKDLHLVIGVVNDKDVTKMLSMMPKNAFYYFAKANIPRGLDAVILKETAAALGLIGKSYSSVRKAFAAAKRVANVEDVVYVGGSTFVVAEVI
jgi:dihydrofolate synthase / folylpolyglutamate synthase